MQKFLVHVIYKISTRHTYRIVFGLLLVALLFIFRSTTWYADAFYSFVDNDPLRGAMPMAADGMGDRFENVTYLDQGWDAGDSLWFYNTTQGSDLMPYDFFLVLEQAGSDASFRSPENINTFRYLPQQKTKSNPDGLPVGMVADTYLGKTYMGFTCAACHTSQVNYKGVGMRIDGGPGAADMDGFMHALEASFQATLNDPAKKKRFIDAVVQLGNWGKEKEVEALLQKYAVRMEAYNFFNESQLNGAPVPYGYARLDAFGRIYNRVLEHVLNPEALQTLLSSELSPGEAEKLLQQLKPVISGEERDRLIEKLARLDIKTKRTLRDKIFNSPNAPVSYPFLWDIPQHDYVQWNGIGANGGVGPVGRNVGEVIGVFGTLDWSQKKGWTISSVLGGQGFGDTHISFKSSVNVHNLRQIEDRLWELQSPSWEDASAKAGLPPINAEKMEKGRRLFAQYCRTCHAEIDRKSPERRIVAELDKLDEAGTDPKMAKNSVEYKGYSGILRNEYMKADVGGVLLDVKAPVAAILTLATQNVVATPDPDKWFLTRGIDWLVDLIRAFRTNEIKPSVKSGKYSPDTTAAPFESLLSYKGRSLNGIWATAPYLHNGSVPTLYDLLLPAEERPAKFRVGSRELDVEKVGFRHGLDEYNGFLFDTSLPANSNKGHEYGVEDLTPEDRMYLVEYLKSL